MLEVIQVAEWGRVELPARFDTPGAKARLLRGAATAFGDALVQRGKHLYAQGLVGVVEAGPLQLQIVPKVYAESTAHQDASLLLELFLVNAPPSKVAVVQATTETHHATVLEPLIRHFATALEIQLRAEGVPRRYEERSEQSSTLRGRIDLSKLVRQSPAYSNRLPIIHYPLQGDNALSRVLRALAVYLAQCSRVGHTKASLYRCADLLMHARSEELRPDLVAAVRLTRYEDPWKQFLDLAKMLAEGKPPNPVRSGEGSTTGLLMPLERLYENALRAALRNAAKTAPLHVSANFEHLRLIRSIDNSRELLSLKPDIMLRDDAGEMKVVGDAKWKRLRLDRPSLGLTPADVYQITSYIYRYSVRQGVLFYPSAVPLGETWRSSSWAVIAGQDLVVHIVELDVGRLLAAALPRPDQGVIADLSRLLVFLASD